MPTYVYRCPACKSEIELIQKISEKISPICFSDSHADKQIEMETVIGSTSFLLKGSGWAKDGYSGG